MIDDLDRLAEREVAEMELLDWEDAPWDVDTIRRCRRAFKRGYIEEAVRQALEARRKRAGSPAKTG